MRLLIKLIVVSALLFTSCTIQKRLFLPGYSVQWKNNSSKTKKETTLDVSKETPHEIARIQKTDSVTPQERILSKGNIVADSSLKIEPVSIVKTDIKTTSNAETKIKTVKEFPKKQLDNPVDKSEEKTSKQKIHPLAFVSLAATILILPSFLLATFNSFYLLIPIILFAFALVVALVSLHIIKKHPEKYRGKWLIFGTLTGLFAILLFVGINLILIFNSFPFK